MEVYEGPIRAAEVEVLLADCPRDKSLSLVCLHYDRYETADRDLRQQNVRVPSSVSGGIVTLVRKDRAVAIISILLGL